jgi:hypothetical protein
MSEMETTMPCRDQLGKLAERERAQAKTGAEVRRVAA